MTAVGFAMIWIGGLVALWFWKPHEGIDEQPNQWMAGIMFAIAGALSFLTGVTIWLYGVMP